MIFFWDKNVPKTIPLALRTLNPPFSNEIYLEHYPLSDDHKEGGDDIWLPPAGDQGWIVLTHDWHLHANVNDRRAIEDYGVGVFYLWGAEAPKWEVLRLFAQCYRRIVHRVETTPRPFIYRIGHTGIITRINLR